MNSTVLSALRRPHAISGGLVAAVLVGLLLLPQVSASTYALGIVFGSATAIPALGLILLYRSSRTLNFAQVQMGAVSAVLFAELVKHGSIQQLVNGVCPGCASGAGWLGPFSYWVALLLSLLAGPAVAAVVYVAFGRRFAKSPPLVLTVVTIAVGSLLAIVVTQWVLFAFDPSGGSNQISGLQVDMRPPVAFSIGVPGGAVISAGQLMLVGLAVLCLAGLMLFLRFARLGVAIRAVAEDGERASQLGIPDFAVQITVWIVAGLLASLGADFQNVSTGAYGGGGVTAAETVRILTVAVLANFDSLPLAFAASIAIGALDQAFFGAFHDNVAVDAVLFALILVALLLRPRGLRPRFDPFAAWAALAEIRPAPRVLRSLAPVRNWRIALIVGALLLVAGLPWLLPPAGSVILTQYALYGLVGLSLLMVTGWAGQLNLGQFAFATWGAWVAAVIAGHLHLPFAAGVLAGAMAGAAISVVVGLPGLRFRGFYLAIASLAFALATGSILLSPHYGGALLPDSLARPQLLGLDGGDDRVYFYFCAIVLLAATLAVAGIRRSRAGRAVIAARDNDRTAESFGIDLLRARLQILAASGFLAALAGALFAYQQRAVNPGDFTPEVGVTMLEMVVIGGLGSVLGPVLGAVFVMLSTLIPFVPQLGPSGGVLLILLVAPAGLAWILYRVRDTFLLRVAERFRLAVPSLEGARRRASDRLPIAPKLTRGGGTAFVEERYRLPGDPRLKQGAVAKPVYRA